MRVPAAVDDVIQRCLEKDPDRRWPGAGELAAAFAEAVGGAAPARRVSSAAAVAIGLHVRGAPEAVAAARMAAQAIGFTTVFVHDDELLVARLLPASAEADRAARAEARELARSVHASSPSLAVTVHVAEVKTLVVAGATQLVGGPLLAVGEWAAAAEGSLVVTPAAAS